MPAPQMTLKHFLFTLVKPYKRYMLTMCFIALIWGVYNALQPYVLKLIIDQAVAQDHHRQGMFTAVMPYLIAYVLLWVVIALDMRALDWVKLKWFPSLNYDIVTKMFGYLTQHSHRYFQNNFAGSLSNKISDMISGTHTIFTTLDDAMAQCFGLAFAIIAMLLVHPIFAIILLLWALCFLGIAYCFLGPIQNLSNVFATHKTSLMGKLVDSIGNITNLRLFARHTHENTLISKATAETVHHDRVMQKKILIMRIWWDASIVVLIGLNLCTLVYMYSHHQVSVGDFSFIISLSISILFNLWWIASQFVVFAEEVGRCRQALTILTTAHEIEDHPHASPLVVTEGKIEFHDVTFHYDENATLFDNKNVILHPGQKIGLVGLSGSGKSSFVHLILRLFDVESGEIHIDGQDISKVTQASLREQIAMIPQDISLFHRSLLENIRYGRVDASDEEVIQASKLAHCHEFIQQLAEGYEALVGERGIKLSGGQRQRIAIARAFLKNAPILILDEATSALDSVTEKLIQDGLHRLMQGRTTLIIAHRLSTLAEMDRILVFSQGKIIEDGSHNTLLQQQGHYARMWHMQAGGFLPDTF